MSCYVVADFVNESNERVLHELTINGTVINDLTDIVVDKIIENKEYYSFTQLFAAVRKEWKKVNRELHHIKKIKKFTRSVEYAKLTDDEKNNVLSELGGLDDLKRELYELEDLYNTLVWANKQYHFEHLETDDFELYMAYWFN